MIENLLRRRQPEELTLQYLLSKIFALGFFSGMTMCLVGLGLQEMLIIAGWADPGRSPSWTAGLVSLAVGAIFVSGSLWVATTWIKRMTQRFMLAESADLVEDVQPVD